MKKYIILICLVTQIVQAQFCKSVYLDTSIIQRLPWYGNNEYLNAMLDSVGYHKTPNQLGANARGTSSATFRYMVPLQVTIYRNNDATNAAITEARVATIVELINQRMANENTRIHFFLTCAIRYVNDTKLNTEIDCGDFTPVCPLWQIVTTKKITRTINLHIIRSNNAGWGGIAVFPQFPVINFNTIVTNNTSNDQFVNTIIHEIGHTIGLFHTFSSINNPFDLDNNGAQDKCRQEAVSRTRRTPLCIGRDNVITCEINGDNLCDTPADPSLISSGVDAACNYTAGGSDRWGDAWAPSTTNYMSYSARNCIGRGNEGFTNQQIAVMWSNLENNASIFSQKIEDNTVLDRDYIIGSGETVNIAGFNTLQVGGNGKTYTANAGSTSINIARNSVDLQGGVQINEGANYEAYTTSTFNCIFPRLSIITSSARIENDSDKIKKVYVGNKIYYLDPYGLTTKVDTIYKNSKNSSQKSVYRAIGKTKGC